ncbi:MAG: type I-B CRISPR-associated protein Cas5b [Sarcina sp.]
MKSIRFDFYGRFAHFKNPENNIKIELSYENIPKTVLLGQLGAILGLRGKQQEKELGYLEFWEVLKNIKIAIIPHSPKWNKHIESFNNSTGFANLVSKVPSNQILRRQVLENVRWTIFILKDGLEEKYFDELHQMLLSRKSKFPIYLGKNEFKARLGEVDLVELEKIDVKEIEKCDSLVLAKFVEEIEREECEEHFLKEELFLRNDYSPVGYNEIGLYNLEKIIFTNSYLKISQGEFYKNEEIILNFY